jgi:hypothetical protein
MKIEIEIDTKDMADMDFLVEIKTEKGKKLRGLSVDSIVDDKYLRTTSAEWFDLEDITFIKILK